MYNQSANTRKGLDVAVIRLKNYLNSNLWSGLNYTAYGIAEIIERDNMILPEVYDSGINYSKIFLEAGKSSTSFFLVDGSRDRVSGLNSDTFNVNVSLIFALNLKKIKPLITTYRAKEDVIEEVIEMIESNDFFINSISTDMDAITDFTFDNKMRRAMHPNLFLNFSLNVTY